MPMVFKRAWAIGLEKSAAFMAEQHKAEGARLRIAGLAHRYPKGHVPANKGLRRSGYAPGRMASTQFTKGERRGAAAQNWKPIGTIMADCDGYLHRKIAEGIGGFGNQQVWEFVHRRVWEDAHGPIPKGNAVVFRDGKKDNTDLSNLELLTRAQLMKRNTIHNLPADLKQVIMLTGALKRKIRKREEKLNGEKHDAGLAGSPVCAAGSAGGRGEAAGSGAS